MPRKRFEKEINCGDGKCRLKLDNSHLPKK